MRVPVGALGWRYTLGLHLSLAREWYRICDAYLLDPATCPRGESRQRTAIALLSGKVLPSGVGFGALTRLGWAPAQGSTEGRSAKPERRAALRSAGEAEQHSLARQPSLL